MINTIRRTPQNTHDSLSDPGPQNIIKPMIIRKRRITNTISIPRCFQGEEQLGPPKIPFKKSISFDEHL